mgnify:CR=1 FL=1
MKYEIVGNSMQSVRVIMDENEKIFADSGKLLHKSANVVMTPRMVGGIVGAIERKFTGATGLLTEFQAEKGSGSVSLSGVMPGKIVTLELGEGDEFVAEHFAFLAAQSSVKFTMQTVGLGPAFFGGAGLVLQKFVGPGILFLHITGDVIEYNLDGTEPIEVDPGHIAAFSSTLEYKIRFVDNIRTAMFGGVGLFLATFTGKGRLIMHTISRFKLSSEMYIEGYQQNPSMHK